MKICKSKKRKNNSNLGDEWEGILSDWNHKDQKLEGTKGQVMEQKD